jgi:hypothetical protein
MAYKIKLNDKIFTSIDAEFGKLTFALTDDVDVLFFDEWIKDRNLRVDKRKKEYYVKRLEYTKITKKGVLINAYPILNDNEDKVYIIYDYKETDGKIKE